MLQSEVDASPEFAIGVDLGGTKILAGLVDRQGQVVEHFEVPTANTDSFDDIFEQIVSLIRKLQSQAPQILGLGVGAPGPLNLKAGVILSMPNLPGENIALRDDLKAIFDLPVQLENDANAALLAEVRFAKLNSSVDNAVIFTLGTGVGGAVFANGDIVHGAVGAAGELGHIKVEDPGLLCGCGRFGCLETIASGPGLLKLAKLSGLADSTKELIHHWQTSGIEACALGRRFCDALALGMSCQINSLNPSHIFISGGFGLACFDLFHDPVMQRLQCLCFPAAVDSTQILLAQTGKFSGVLGAASPFLKR